MTLRLKYFRFVVLFTFLGGMGGCAIDTGWIPTGAWTKITVLPFQATQLLDVWADSVIVSTTDGTIYECSINVENVCSQLDAVPEPYKDSRSCGEPGTIFPLYPGKVVDSIAMRYCGYEGSTDEHAILLEDGSVWRWISPGGGNEWFTTFFADVLLGAFDGMGIGIILVLLRLALLRHIKRHGEFTWMRRRYR